MPFTKCRFNFLIIYIHIYPLQLYRGLETWWFLFVYLETATLQSALTNIWFLLIPFLSAHNLLHNISIILVCCVKVKMVLKLPMWTFGVNISKLLQFWNTAIAGRKAWGLPLLITVIDQKTKSLEGERHESVSTYEPVQFKSAIYSSPF